MQKIYSVLIWTGIILLVLIWLPLIGITWLVDRDPLKYKTGRLFRKLGLAISRINPNWKISLTGYEPINDREPYIVVSNHLSNADIPLISNLPWEMKWVAKKELFSMPILGWMMTMAGDISVDRSSTNKRVGVFKRCKYYLENNISVMFFPEGTRSRSGKLNRFSPGAFDLAIKENIAILPIVLDGTMECLPKKSWVFKPDVIIKMKVLEPVSTDNLSESDALELMKKIRGKMLDQLSEWRSLPAAQIDGTIT